MKPLTEREREVLELVAAGHTAAEIARRLHIAVNTVRAHYAMIRAKFDCHTMAGAVAIALREGLLDAQTA